MFDWFKKKKSPASDPVIVLGVLIRGLDNAENLLRLGKDAQAVEQLRMMAIPAARSLARYPDALKALTDLFELLIKTRQIELAKEILPYVERVTNAAGHGTGISEALRMRLQKSTAQSSVTHSDGVPQAAVIYVCQKCGFLNNFLTDPCLRCGFVAKDLRSAQVGMMLSNVSIAPDYFLPIGELIGMGARPEEYLPEFEQNLLRVPVAEARRIANLASAAKPPSTRYPDWPSLAKCPGCGNPVTLGKEKVCTECKRPFSLTSIQTFIVATGQCLNSLHEIIEPPKSPTFRRLLGMLVVFLASAFRRGEVPSAGERKDALACMREMRSLNMRDNAMTIIFTPEDDIQMGVNVDCKEMKFSEREYHLAFGAWCELQNCLRNGIALR